MAGVCAVTDHFCSVPHCGHPGNAWLAPAQRSASTNGTGGRLTQESVRPLPTAPLPTPEARSFRF